MVDHGRPGNAGDSEDDQRGRHGLGQLLSAVTGLHQHSTRWTKSARPGLSDQPDRQKESTAVHQP
jgi:hypothetical protein